MWRREVRLTPEDSLVPLFTGLGIPLVVCGHSHMQFDRTVSGVRVVNAGSVGMPFAEPGAYWLLLGPDELLDGMGHGSGAAAPPLRPRGLADLRVPGHGNPY